MTVARTFLILFPPKAQFKQASIIKISLTVIILCLLWLSHMVFLDCISNWFLVLEVKWF